MSLFANLPEVTMPRQRNDVALLHRMGCKACPLAKLKNLNPDMPASGAEKPVVYILGEGPGKEEDKQDRQFVGESGELLRARIPREFIDKIRFNNVVRTRPENNATPTFVEVECCRPSVEKDIEQSKPLAIFGFGNVPLEWVMGSTLQGITMWRGRRTPVKIGNHSCWYYPMLHPSYLIRQQRVDRETGDPLMSEDERMFRFDLKTAFDEVYDLPPAVVHTPTDVWSGLECITEGGAAGLQSVEEWLHWASKQPHLGLDYETDRLRPYGPNARILTAALATTDKGFAFPFEHPDAEWSDTEFNKVVKLWKEFLRTYKGVKFVHNLAFELEWTGVWFNDTSLIRAGDWEDSQTQASIIDERKGKNKPGCFSLEFLVQQHFGFNLKKLSNLDRKALAKVSLDLVLRYNGGDAKYHCALGLAQRKLINKEGLEEIYDDSLRRVPTVVLSQIKGVPVDNEETELLKVKYNKRIKEIWDKIFEQDVIKDFQKHKHTDFKPLSNPDVLYVFKDLLHSKECVVWDKYKQKERYSADEDVLEKMDHPLAKLLIQYRKANRQLSTYILPLDPNYERTVIHPDGLIHPVFNTVFARTGRLSCEEPNLQFYPKRGEEAKEVRKQVKAGPREVIFTVDYGQIEARVIAMFTKDEVFCKALWEDYDIHMEWAERIAMAFPARIGGSKNFKDKKVMKDFRTDIKNQWTFPLFFGARAESAAGYLSLEPNKKFYKLYDDFWYQFRGVREWQKAQMKFYHEFGYVQCLTGRRRHGPLSENKIYNSPVQGTAADIVMDGMCRLSEIGDPELQPEINIHDDLTYCRVPLDKVDVIAERVITEMLSVPYEFVNVPITVEAGVGDDWLNIEEFGKFSSNTWLK